MLTSKTIGERITEARKQQQLSQAQLAEHLFISAQAVGKWERGESLPDILMLNRLAELLNVDLNYFVGQTAAPPAEATPAMIAAQAHAPVKEPAAPKWDLSRGNWTDADFSGLKNLNDKFSSSNIQRCKFVDSDLSGLLLKGNNIQKCDFSHSDFSKGSISRSNLDSNLFVNCSLNNSTFTGSFLRANDFTNADFSGVTLQSGGFEKNTLLNALWQRTTWKETYLADLEFNGTITDCVFENCSFKRVIFRNATLTNTFFKNNSLKNIRFEECQADRLTYEFLKIGKADLSGITLLNE